MPTVFVGNLAGNVTDSDLRTLFERFGKINSLRHVRRRGIAYIELEEDAANTAVAELRGTQLNDRTLDIALDQGGGGKPGGRRRKGRR